MTMSRRQLVKRVTVAVAAVYLLLVLGCLTVNASWKAVLGREFRWDEALECVYGPAITLASVALLWSVIYAILVVVNCRKNRSS